MPDVGRQPVRDRPRPARPPSTTRSSQPLRYPQTAQRIAPPSPHTPRDTAPASTRYRRRRARQSPRDRNGARPRSHRGWWVPHRAGHLPRQLQTSGH
ncbi:hypothetical protein CZ674_06835 [Agrococcus casei LMG 22410]|uniref:Uncharacterized protein n=1 Tax=Agrococcus casei LMG 22410 TaxID=1255656 RepID=A0A1R4FVQ0_9MICO|nr:hypothetical protein CZ674_06835 [Agrococcus casei LMG 22410]